MAPLLQLLMQKDDEDPILDLCPPPPPHLPPVAAMEKKERRVFFDEHLLQGPCDLRLCADLLPIPSLSGEKPSLSCHIFFLDKTKVILPSQWGADRCYMLPCPFDDDDRLSFDDFRLESSHFVRCGIPRDITMERRYRDFFESEMTRFVAGRIKEAAGRFHVDVHVTASIDRKLWHEETVEAAKKIEEELLMRSNEPEEKEDGSSWGTITARLRDCAVCFEGVEMSRFEGVQLDCHHVFHVSCIAPWLVRKNTCPMCRRVQVAHVS